MASTTIARRRFLTLSAMAAATGALAACGGPPTAQPAQNATAAPAQATAAPAAAAAPAPTVATINVSNVAPTAAPTVAAAPTTAPAAGATTAASGKFKEAPQLADLVKAGKIPPVDQRIPLNPRVIKPAESVGQYGGTLHGAYRGLSDRWGPTKLQEEMLIAWDIPDSSTIKLTPNIVEKWDQNADASEFTFYL